MPNVNQNYMFRFESQKLKRWIEVKRFKARKIWWLSAKLVLSSYL